MLCKFINPLKIKMREKLNPLFAPKRMEQLRKANNGNNIEFTIISNNCWAGHVYRYFGLPYSSPTIGLFFFSEDYIKFVSDLKKYLALDFKFITYKESRFRKELETYGGECIECPIGILGDIEVVFLHYKTPEDALKKWNRRKSRINWDNIYYKMSEMNLCTQEHLAVFDELPTSKKVVFTTKNYHLKSQVIWGDSFMEDSISDDTTNFQRYINLTDFLSGKPFGKHQKRYVGNAEN